MTRALVRIEAGGQIAAVTATKVNNHHSYQSSLYNINSRIVRHSREAIKMSADKEKSKVHKLSLKGELLANELKICECGD